MVLPKRKCLDQADERGHKTHRVANQSLDHLGGGVQHSLLGHLRPGLAVMGPAGVEAEGVVPVEGSGVKEPAVKTLVPDNVPDSRHRVTHT